MRLVKLTEVSSSHTTPRFIYSRLAAWRIVVGLSLIPAFGTLYQRLTLPESTRYLATKKLESDESTIEQLKNYARTTEGDRDSNNGNQLLDEKKQQPVGVHDTSSSDEATVASIANTEHPDRREDITEVAVKRAHFRGMSTIVP